MNSRMTLSAAVTQRMLHGALNTIRDDGKTYIEYDSVTASFLGGHMVLDLRADGVVISSVGVNCVSGDIVTLTGLEGRMELRIE